MAFTRSRRTDYGTIVWHWLLVACLVVALATGLRIAADEPALRWLTSLDAVLPRENLWLWHVIGALAFSACFCGYATYVVLAKLTQRIRFDVSRAATLVRGGPVRWASLGVIVLWVAFVVFVVEIVSGVLLYLGHADSALWFHRNAMWICLGFPIVHVALHVAAGGVQQVLRIFRPVALALTPPEPDILSLLAEHIQLVDDLRSGRPTKPVIVDPVPAAPRRVGLKPFVTSLSIAAAVGLAGIAVDRTTSTILGVPLVGQIGGAERPLIDGDTSDPVWVAAPSVTIMTEEGANFGGAGQSRVEIRAVHDLKNVYMAISWEDPTRSLKHLPLMKEDSGWQVVRSQANPAIEETFNEDKLAILVSRPTIPIVGAAIHLSASSLPGYPRGASGRGLHYMAAGLSDLWVWRAAHGGVSGYLEDGSFAAPLEPTPAQRAGRERYTGGFAPDPGDGCYVDNTLASAGAPLTPARIPKDLARTAAGMGQIHGSGVFSEDEGSEWWLTVADSQAYSADADKAVPLGTLIPGVLVLCAPSGDEADVRGIARWSAGRWTLELVRALDTGSGRDLPIVSGDMIWLGAFDHASTYHTRHIRPVTLELE